MVHFTPNISIITLNVNVLNTTIKSQRLSEQIQTIRPNYNIVYKKSTLNIKNIDSLKLRDGKRYTNYANTSADTKRKKVGVAILISGKADFRTKSIRDKEIKDLTNQRHIPC